MCFSKPSPLFSNCMICSYHRPIKGADKTDVIAVVILLIVLGSQLGESIDDDTEHQVKKVHIHDRKEENIVDPSYVVPGSVVVTVSLSKEDVSHTTMASGSLGVTVQYVANRHKEALNWRRANTFTVVSDAVHIPVVVQVEVTKHGKPVDGYHAEHSCQHEGRAVVGYSFCDVPQSLRAVLVKKTLPRCPRSVLHRAA